MKKSYLSKQAIAAIVILTVIAVLVPLYIFVLKPMLTKEETPEASEDIYEPVIGIEQRVGVSSLVGKTRGGYVALYSANLPTDTQAFSLHAKSGDWGFKVYDGSSLSLDGYESMLVDEAIYDVYMTICRPIGTHVAPASDALIAIQKEKAGKMSEEELSALGGWNQVPLTGEDVAGIEIDYAEYGLADLSAVDCVSYIDADGKTVKLYLGDYTLDGLERYACFEGLNVVYKLDSTRTANLSLTVFDVMPAVVFDVTDGAATGDYVLDRFILWREGQIYVNIQKFPDSEVLAMDRLTRSLFVDSYQTEDGETVQVLYDTSSEYTILMHQYFMSEIQGMKVIYAAKSELVTTEEGYRYYAHGEITDEELQYYGFDTEKPYRVLDTFKYTNAAQTQYLENILIFSKPYEENSTRYFNVYNLLRGTIVRMPAAFMPFIEEEREYYISKYISMLSINDLDTLTVDSTALPGGFLYGGVERFSESFTLGYQMDGSKRATTSSGLEIIEKITLSNGKEAPGVTGGDNAVENFRHFYYHFGTVMMYANNLKDFLEDIEKVDRTKPGLTLTYSVYGTDRSHRMDFYFFDESGYWAFYTLDGDGRYIVKTEDLQRLLLGLQAVRDGKSVIDVLGPIGS